MGPHYFDLKLDVLVKTLKKLNVAVVELNGSDGIQMDLLHYIQGALCLLNCLQFTLFANL